MHPADIKAAIYKKGFTLKELSISRGFKPQDVSNCFETGRPSVEVAISEFLDISLYVLWPDRYRPDGLRKNPRDSRKSSAHSSGKSTAKNKQSVA